MKKKVVIIGGGLAGIAAAVNALQKGYQVELLEKRQFLGGRAFSLKRDDTPHLDNGQHVVLGCYAAFNSLLATLGSNDGIGYQKDLEIPFRGIYRNQNIDQSLTTSHLPAPLHLLGGLCKLPAFSLKQKLQTTWIGKAIFSRSQLDHQDLSVTKWLSKYHQPDIAKHWLWAPITIAALNRHPDKASARLLAEVLYRAFFCRRNDSAIGIFKNDLSSVCAEPARKYIEANGGTIRYRTSVQKLLHNDKHLNGVVLQDGHKIKANYFVSAVPHFRFNDWLNGDLEQAWPAVRDWHKLGTSPIITVYLLYHSNPLVKPLHCLLGSRSEWVFNLNHLLDEKDRQRGRTLVSITISDANDLLATDVEAIAGLAHDDLKRFFPDSCPDDFDKSWVIKEKRATMNHCPENEAYRPSSLTPFSNFFLAGDWTDTKLPSTLEGAVISGNIAASHLPSGVSS